ncbi:hypothetical protein [Bifidobacterium sp.]|jgi:hypothetical protein|uniref:hypothetical protein n=1 Tax=Bifidobacterium sp. TaxID=41200 RepID=UPI0025C001A6|nr:hypothetical protein [Bifidobacterium sp.]MCH4208944.1 hypothetical protein [Bifidobacterium sp.]
MANNCAFAAVSRRDSGAFEEILGRMLDAERREVQPFSMTFTLYRAGALRKGI